MSDDEGPPPLEDMTEYVNKIAGDKVKYEKIHVEQQLRPEKGLIVEQKENKETPLVKEPISSNKKAPTSTRTTKSDSVGYAGMRKGFLSGGLSSSKRKVPAEKKITEIKANPKAKEDVLKLKEVQDKMSEANDFLSENSNEWMNENLLNTLQSNKTVSSKLNNPQFMAAFAEFQTNPHEAAKKYADNQEMKEFIQEFSGLLGSHFTGLADKQNANSS